MHTTATISVKKEIATIGMTLKLILIGFSWIYFNEKVPIDLSPLHTVLSECSGIIFYLVISKVK